MVVTVLLLLYRHVTGTGALTRTLSIESALILPFFLSCSVFPIAPLLVLPYFDQQADWLLCRHMTTAQNQQQQHHLKMEISRELAVFCLLALSFFPTMINNCHEFIGMSSLCVVQQPQFQ